MEQIQYLYMNTTALAFLGDAVYEVYVREYLVRSKQVGADRLHKETVKYVRAEAQAVAMKLLLDNLSEEELTLVKRARNKRTISKPQNADPVLYKWATAFEALIGYLHISGNSERLVEIVESAMEKVRSNGKKTGTK